MTARVIYSIAALVPIIPAKVSRSRSPISPRLARARMRAHMGPVCRSEALAWSWWPATDGGGRWAPVVDATVRGKVVVRIMINAEHKDIYRSLPIVKIWILRLR
jgi:hypothetical protein